MAVSGIPSARPVVTILLLGIIVLVASAWWTSQAAVRSQRRAVTECRQRYAAARTLADSGQVDMVRLQGSWGRVAGKGASRTCGDLRLAGRLK
jgi:hypothetical protein